MHDGLRREGETARSLRKIQKPFLLLCDPLSRKKERNTLKIMIKIKLRLCKRKLKLRSYCGSLSYKRLSTVYNLLFHIYVYTAYTQVHESRYIYKVRFSFHYLVKALCSTHYIFSAIYLCH